MGNAVNHGDVRRYDATAAESYDEGLLDVFCPSLSDTVLVAVPPGFSPVGLLSTPDPGTPIVIEERFGANMEQSITWVGWTPAVQESVPWQREGMTALLSPDREVVVLLDQGVDDDADPDPPACRIGRYDATEKAVLGDTYKAWTEGQVDETVELLDRAVDTLGELSTMQAALVDYMAAATQAWILTAAAVPVTLLDQITAMGVEAATIAGIAAPLATINSQLASLRSNILAHKGEIGDHLSALVTIASE